MTGIELIDLSDVYSDVGPGIDPDGEMFVVHVEITLIPRQL